MGLGPVPGYIERLTILIDAPHKPHHVARLPKAISNCGGPGRNVDCLSAANAEVSSEIIPRPDVFPFSARMSDQHMRFVLCIFSRNLCWQVHFPNVVRTILKRVWKAPKTMDFHHRISGLSARPSRSSGRNKTVNNKGVVAPRLFASGKLISRPETPRGGLCWSHSFTSRQIDRILYPGATAGSHDNIIRTD